MATGSTLLGQPEACSQPAAAGDPVAVVVAALAFGQVVAHRFGKYGKKGHPLCVAVHKGATTDG